MISRIIRNTSSRTITHAKLRKNFLNLKQETSRRIVNPKALTLLGKCCMEVLSKRIITQVSQKINFRGGSDLLFFHTMLL
jgi:hypothetical protein